MAEILKRVAYVLAGIGIIFLIGMILFGRNGYFDYLDLKQRQAQLVQERQAMEAGNLGLRRRITRLRHDADYIRHVARQELGMVGKDEIIYKYKPEKEQP